MATTRNLNAIARALPPAATTALDATTNPLGGFGGSPFHPPAPANTNPLVAASYGDWSAGRAGTGLPRDWRTFMAGMFGPLQPMQPMPIDAPPPGEERPEPRRFQYPVSWNMPHGVPGDEGLKLASFAQLRVIGDTYSVARACIQTRTQEILGIDWDIVPTKEAEKKLRGDQDGRREFDERRTPVKKFFKKPDSDYFNFGSWLNALLEDIFVVDAMTMYLWPAKRSGKGVAGSDLGQLAALDGTTIRPYLDIHGSKPAPPNPAYAQYLYGVPRTDLMSILSGEDVKDMGDAKVKDYRGDRLLYLPYVTRTWTPYGFGPIERSLMPIMSALQRQQYQAAYFSDGSVPSVFVSVGDANASPAQCRELQNALNAMAGDPAWKHRIIVIPGGAKIDPMRPNPLADAFDDLVMTQVCMGFDVMPMELGITPRSSTTTSGGAQNQMAKASENVNQRKALKPLLKWLKEIFDTIIQVVLGYTDMQWHWEGLEEGEDEAASVETLLGQLKVGGLSIDELRVQRGHQPWGIDITSQPVYMTATGVIPLGSIDMKTGQPVGAPPPGPGMGALGAGGGPVGGGGKPRGGGDGGGAATPAHAAAAAAADAAEAAQITRDSLPEPAKANVQDLDELRDSAEARLRKAVGALTGDLLEKVGPKGYEHGWKKVRPGVGDIAPAQKPAKLSEAPPAPAVVDVPAALRELDLIRRRVVKGRTLDGWTVAHLPQPVFDQLAADCPQDADTAIDNARNIIKSIGRRQRRDTTVQPLSDAITGGLRALADQVADGDLSTLGFVDHAVALLHTNIAAALDAGVQHAIRDRLGQHIAGLFGLTGEQTTRARLVKADDGLDPRLRLYAGTAAAAYELGYGLATLGEADDPDNIVVRWHPRPDACALCAAREGQLFTVGTLPGWPGDGGFGPDADVCEGGPNCRCTLSYEMLSTLGRIAAGPLERGDPNPDVAAMRTALQAWRGGDPKPVQQVIDRVAADRAEVQRPFLMRLLKDLLSALTRAANRIRGITKGGGELADEVYDYLNRHYPGRVLGWVRDAKWFEPVMVSLSDVDMARRPGGRDQSKVEGIAAAVRDGKKLDPCVLVDVPGEERLQIADGYHRTLGRQHAGKKRVLAYVGTVDTAEGPWDRAMHDAKLNKAGGRDHWRTQPRDPSGDDAGQWVRGPQTAEQLVARFGNLADEATVGRYSVRAYDGGEGRTVLTVPDADRHQVLGVFDPGDADALADDVEGLAAEAREYDADDDEHFDTIVETTTPQASGTYVAYDAGSTVHLMVDGSDDHRFEPDDADELAEALRSMDEVAQNAAVERAEREEDERLEREEREQEAREAAEAWWEDAYETYGNNGLTMASPTLVGVEDLAGGGYGRTTASVQEMGPLAAAIRELHGRGEGLVWEPDDDDDEEPDSVAEVAVSNRLTLHLLEDGDMLLNTRDPDGTIWDIAVWRDNAVELADGLDGLHAQVLAAPKPRVDKRRGHDGWRRQPRVRSGEHGGEWTDGPVGAAKTVAALAGDMIQRRESLARSASSGTSGTGPLNGGRTAETELVTFNDGTQAVRKKLGSGDFGNVHGTPQRQADAEELAALVAQAVGVRVPAVHRTAPDEIYMEYINDTAKVGADLPWRSAGYVYDIVRIRDDGYLDHFGMSGQYDKLDHYVLVGPRPDGDSGIIDVFADRDDAAAMLAGLQAEAAKGRPADFTEQGLRIGLLDLLIGNADRNDANWIQQGNDIVGIDHAGAWNDMEDWPPFLNEDRDFGQEFLNYNSDVFGIADHPMTPADMARVRERITALEPEFERLGHRDWWTWTLDRVDQLAEQATGTKDLIP